MEKDKVLQEFLSAVKLRTEGANPLEKIMVSLKDHFPPLSDERLPKSSSSDIDCVVSDLQRLVTAMKIHRNTLIPIHHLPDDVLSLIFRTYCFGDDDHSIYSTQRWAQIMFVCRRWFNLITDDSFLWSFIDIDESRRYVDRIRMQLKRSKNHLLSIRHEYSTQLGIYTLLSKEAHRIGALRLSAPADIITAVWNNFLGSNLPPLHSLSIHAHAGTDLALPDSFLAIPSLRQLSLRDVGFSVALLPSNLVDLDLSTSSRELRRLDIWVFLGLLSHMTQLQKLRFDDFVTVQSDNRPAVAPPRVLLPKLLELSIGIH
ncbi:hypothetical protein BDZ89DRAFT_1140491 [Hymenopellis radicata]|nr:hypothetical protein BDZ89DRAFT_1140491 [Hymenopellis radicata]